MSNTSFPSLNFPGNAFNPVRVVARKGFDENLRRIKDFDHIAVVTSAGFLNRGLLTRVRAALGDRAAEVISDVTPNPELDLLVTQASKLTGSGVEAIVGVGGGSVIDSAKALGVLASNPAFDLRAHLVDGEEYSVESSIPVFAVPTTAGTGAEVTPFATVWDSVTKKKYSLTGPGMYPAEAWLDAELSISVPYEVTVATGMDAISQALESVWNKNANDYTANLAYESLQRSLNTLPKLVQNLNDVELRQIMLEASLLAGLAISHTRTAIAHSMSYPLTLHFGLPHGLAASFTLPAVLRFNAQYSNGSHLFGTMNKLGFASAEQFARNLERIMDMLSVREITSRYIPNAESATRFAAEMFTPGRADNNIRTVNPEDIRQILHDSLV